MSQDKHQMQKRTIGDAAHAFTKAGLSVIPIVGGPAVELFQYLLQPPLERRREAWMASVGEKLQELESQGFKLEDLQNNELFVTAVMHATQMALKTHQAAKLAALSNAIINIARGQAPEEAIQHLFLDYVDSLTELHLRILAVFNAPTAPPGMSMGGLSSVLEHNIPELNGRRELYDQLWRDLYSRGLVNTDGLHTTMSGSGLTQKRTTGLGDSFLGFISDSESV